MERLVPGGLALGKIALERLALELREVLGLARGLASSFGRSLDGFLHVAKDAFLETFLRTIKSIVQSAFLDGLGALAQGPGACGLLGCLGLARPWRGASRRRTGFGLASGFGRFSGLSSSLGRGLFGRLLRLGLRGVGRLAHGRLASGGPWLFFGRFRSCLGIGLGGRFGGRVFGLGLGFSTGGGRLLFGLGGRFCLGRRRAGDRAFLIKFRHVIFLWSAWQMPAPD